MYLTIFSALEKTKVYFLINPSIPNSYVSQDLQVTLTLHLTVFFYLTFMTYITKLSRLVEKKKTNKWVNLMPENYKQVKHKRGVCVKVYFNSMKNIN